MRKFILKSSLIIFPFLCSYIFYVISFNKEGNELARMGNLKLDYDFFNTYPELQFNSIHFESLLNNTKKKYQILNIGDSYSRQEINKINGYVNFLGRNTSLLNMYARDPVNRIQEVIKSNTLDTLEIEYIILQSVERSILGRLINHQKINNTSLSELKRIDNANYKTFKKNDSNSREPKGLFSKATIFFTLNYFLKVDLQNKVLKLKTRKKLFSFDDNEVLFYKKDINILDRNNDISIIKTANDKLNKIALELKKKNIKLIILIAPDKYDFYYSDILNSPFSEPIFFNVLDSLPKDYLYFNSKKLLSSYKDSKKDLYFFDDSHWSPLASKVIANEINNTIKKDKSLIFNSLNKAH
jgi:hypothetical protein